MSTPVAESYLETIYNMSMEGDRVLGVSLAGKFGVSRATVTETVKRLIADGLVEQNRQDGISLTQEGITVTEGLLRRHRLAERLLFDVLGMDFITAHEQAHALEHWISPEVEERISNLLRHPQTCPHGNPIPGNAPSGLEYLRQHRAARLSEANLDSTVRVLAISEVVEDESALLRQLMGTGIVPGRHLTVVGHDAERGVTKFRTDEGESSVSIDLAAKIWVAAVEMAAHSEDRRERE